MDHDGTLGNWDYDIAIVGGGPAGLSAAALSARFLHRVALIDSGDPRNWESRGVNGYLGLPGVRPADLRGRGREECATLGVDLIDGTVLCIERDGPDEFILSIGGGAKKRARRVLLAIGMRDVWPDIPGLSRVFGANAHVCPDCDGYGARNKKVVVIGTGRRAVAMALALTTWTSDIIISTNGRPPELDEPEYCQKLDALNIPVLTDRIVRLSYTGTQINALELETGMSLDAEKVFFTLAQYPADDLGAQLGCDRDRGGHIQVNAGLETSVEHVFAAGDITPGPQFAITAAAEGAVAAGAMHRSLVPSERKLEEIA